MSDNRPIDEIAHGVPGVAVSHTSTRENRTGSWKYIRPVRQDKVAPCNQGCPVGVDVEGAMNLLREGKVQEAIDLVLRENPIPAVTGRVCYHPCEDACHRGSFDEAVSVHAVERLLGDLALEVPAPRRDPARDERVAVVGSGPAGIACAYHLARLGYGVTVFEGLDAPGGILRYGIPEYRLPKSVLERELDRVRAMGVEFRCGATIGREVPWSALEEFDAVFLGVGAHHSRSLGIPGEELPGVMPGLSFLAAVNRGQRPRLGARVTVIGGGNTAMDCARTARRLGAEVVVLYRRTRDEMPAHAEEVEEALREGVRFEFLAAPVAVIGGERRRPREPMDEMEGMFNAGTDPDLELGLDAVECARMRLGEPDATGRRRPEPTGGPPFRVAADSVLVAVGEDPELSGLPPDLPRQAGVVRVNPLGGTGRAAVFAGGDMIESPRTVAFALGSGKRAALGIDRWLLVRRGEATDGVDLRRMRWGEGNVSMARWRGDDPVRRTDPVQRAVGWEEMNPAHFVHLARHPDRARPHGGEDFAETNVGLSPADALAEAHRCLNCGVCNECELCLIYCPDLAITRRPGGGFDIDYDYCKGCGVCSAECPRGAITMTREGL